MSTNFQAILFDLDGTLLDTLSDLADSMNAALVALGFPAHPEASYRYFVGDGVGELAVRVLPENRRDSASVQACLDAMRKEYGQRWADKTRAYSGIDALLLECKKRHICMNVLSNKPHQITNTMIQHFFPEAGFTCVEGLKEGRPRKPDPAAALEIAGNSGIKPGGFIYLGDTNTDMQTARSAGMKPIGALWGFRTREELLANGAEEVIEKPMEILKFFK
jgi:phosphoglycolate phosphatase